MVDAVGGMQVREVTSTRVGMQIEAESLGVFDPDAVVIMSPHAPVAADAFLVDGSGELSGSLAQFGDPTTYRYRGDPDLATEIVNLLNARKLPAALRNEVGGASAGVLDHAVLVPMSFLDPGGRWPLVVLSLSFLPYAMHREVGEAVCEAATHLGRRVAFVASGDMSHRLKNEGPYSFSPFGPELDAAIRNLIEAGDLEGLAEIDDRVIEGGGECGLRSFIALGGFAGHGHVPTRVLSYEGPWGVGYMTALVGDSALTAADSLATVNERGEAAEDTERSSGDWEEPGQHVGRDESDNPAFGITPDLGHKGGTAGDDHSEIVRLARSAIETYVREGKIPDVTPLEDPALPARAGAFVSLHRNGMLRGCIGTIVPTKATLADEVVGNAIEAATNDPRFGPLEASELADLDVKVDVLHEAEQVSSLEELDVKRYGCNVSCGYRRGLLLPDLEGVDDVNTQVSIAMQKGGILPNEPVCVERFRVDRYT
jgi:AmmeMemoRadiSam system protein A